MGYLDYAGLQYLWGKLKEKFAPKSHSHDDRYYTEAEMDGKLNSKVNNNEAGADSLLSKLTTSWTATPTDNTYFIRQDTGGGDSFGRVKFSTLWNYIKGKADGTYQPKGSYSTTDTKNTAGSTNTTSKLYLIGSTSQSANPQTYSNASVYTTGSTIYANGFGNDIFIIYPSGGSASYGGQQIGYCKITLPTLWDSTMMTFTVTIYNYVSNTSVDYRISGYNYAGKPWYNCAAVCVGKAGTSHSNLSVRFGDNGTKNVITIGEEDTKWEYPRIVVHDVVIGNSNFETYKSGWNVEISKSGAPNVSETISNTHVGYNAVTSWDKIQNKPSSFTPASHTHDDRYYTETEMNAKLDGKANAYHTHYSISTIADNRNTNTTPNDYNGTLIFQGMKFNNKINSPSSDTYSYLLGLRGWADSSGGNSHELAFNNTGVYWRNGSSEWGGWNRIYADNYHPNADYATNAGSASNATKATSADSAGKLTMGDAQTALSGTASPTAGLTVNKVYGNGYPTTYGNVITVHGSGSGQIVAGWSGTSGAVERLYYRNKRDTSDANWSSWKTVAFTDDKPATAGTADVANSVDWSKVQNKPSSYPPASHSHAYLPIIGGTMSGQITKSTGGSWIGDRDRAAIKSSYAGDSSYGAVAAMATKNGYWTMGNLGGNENLIFNYSTDAKYNAGKNETSQVYLPAQAGTIITSATIGSQSVNYANRAGNADVANSVDWSKVQNKPSSYAPASHTHDDRYYTESEVNTKLANYQPKGNYAAASHTHNYAGSGTAGGSANSAVKLDSSAGSATQPVYFKDGKPVATTYALNKTVPADAKFTDTNTWRGIQNNLTSDSTDQSLSAAQGKALKTLVDGKAPASHKHTKSQITDFPTSMPASDVSAWAKAATKPSYTKAEVGLGNVDNTADKDKSVKYAASAGSASQLNGFTIQASTSDLTAGYSRLNNNVIYIVYE